MHASAAVGNADFKIRDSRLAMNTLYSLALLALVSVSISIAGKWFGHKIALGGHTQNLSTHEIVIGNNVITVPANMIRFERARRDGVAARLDLYLRYPQMNGYSETARDDFNRTGTGKNIVFLAFEEQVMSRDMSGRFAPIYSALIAQPGRPGPGGTTVFDFAESSGYLNETLVIAERAVGAPFVARCLKESVAEQALAPCERDILVGERLSLTYRFPRQMLADWQELDAAVAKAAAGILKTGIRPPA